MACILIMNKMVRRACVALKRSGKRWKSSNARVSIHVKKKFDGATWNQHKSSVLMKSPLSPSNVILTKYSHALCDLFNASFKDINNAPDKSLKERLGETVATRYRKIRLLSGKQKFHAISLERKAFDWNEMELNISDETGFIQSVPTFNDNATLPSESGNDYRETARHYSLVENDIMLNPLMIDYFNFVTVFVVSEHMFNYLYDTNIDITDKNIDKNINSITSQSDRASTAIDDSRKYFEYSFDIALTLTRVKVSANELEGPSKGSNSPEGIHQDGDCITYTGPVINRYNINGGENIMYDLNKKQLFDPFIMNPGEGLIVDDRTYWHYITDMEYSPNTNANDDTGFRDIVICTLNFNDPKLNRWNKSGKFTP